MVGDVRFNVSTGILTAVYCFKKTATTKNYPINNKYYQELYEDKAEKCLYEKNSTCLEFCGLHYADHISFVNDFVKR